MADAPLYAFGLWLLAIPQWAAYKLTDSDVLAVTMSACLGVALGLLIAWFIGVGSGRISG